MDELEEYVRNQPLPSRVFFALVETTAQLVEMSDRHWQEQGISGARIRILTEMMKEGGELLPSTLAERIGVTRANISLLLVPLEKDDLIRRMPHAEDGRKSRVSITPEGRELLRRALPGNRKVVASRLETLEEEEMRQLLGLLAKLRLS